MEYDYNKNKPLLKWVGGKSKLLQKIIPLFPKEITNYHELFLGGGSVLLSVLTAIKDNKLKVTGKICAYDSNPILIAFYRAIRGDYKKLYETVRKIMKAGEKNDKKEYFYHIRKIYNSRKEINLMKVAEFVYLNKTCFRGLFRLNQMGGFNVPYGHYDNPSICDETSYKQISELISDVEFYCLDFETGRENIDKGDFVYMDPPYVPEKKNGFVSYSKDGFSKEKHETLFKICEEADFKFVLSNSNTDIVKDSFKNFTILEIDARRAIHSKNPGSKTKEILIYN